MTKYTVHSIFVLCSLFVLFSMQTTMLKDYYWQINVTLKTKEESGRTKERGLVLKLLLHSSSSRKCTFGPFSYHIIG